MQYASWLAPVETRHAFLISREIKVLIYTQCLYIHGHVVSAIPTTDLVTAEYYSCIEFYIGIFIAQQLRRRYLYLSKVGRLVGR